jgi:hypothetical protein
MTAVADMSVSGHVNYKAGLLEDFQSNGVSGAGNEDLTVGTAGTSESRFRILSSIEANGLTYATNIELGLGEPGRANALNKRFNEIMVSGAFGKLSLGQGSSAGDGATENDFSGTYLTAGDLTSWELGAGADEVKAGFTLDPETGDIDPNEVANPEPGLADNNSIDIGRTERLRYDAPTIGNLHLALSINDAAEDDSGNDYALAATYKLPSFVITLASVTKEADDSDVIEASVAGKVNNFTAALGYHTEEFAKYGLDTDKEQTHVILGYNPGPFSVSIDFQTTTIDGVKDLDAETTGLNFVYRPAKGVEVYAGARNAQADNGDIDENAFLMGARVKF